MAARREYHRLVHRTSGLSAQLGSTGAHVATEVLSMSVQDAGASTEILGTEQVLFLQRLRSLDGVPIAVIHTWLPVPAYSGLTSENLTDASLHAVLGEKYGVRITSGKRQIRAVPGDADLLQLLRLDVGSPVLLLEGTSYNQDGNPVEVFSTWHRPDHVVFDIDIHREPGRPTESDAPASSAGTSVDTVADRARCLGADLMRFADEVTRKGH